MTRREWLALLAWGALGMRSARARPPDPGVSVRVLSRVPPPTATLRLLAPGELRCDGQARRRPAGERLQLSARPDGVVVAGLGVFRAVTVRAPLLLVGARRYGGSLTFRAPDGVHLYAVCHLGLEAYVAGVCASEALPGVHGEALRAQAVASRSFAAALRGARAPHAAEGYDFCDRTHCQSFAGLPPPGHAAWTAADSTRGHVLWARGRILPAWYHSTCGGHTAASVEIFGSVDPDFTGVEDAPPSRRASRARHPWCAASPHFRWRASLAEHDLLAALRSDPEVDPGLTLRGLRVLERGPSGRVTRFAVDGPRPAVVGGWTLWLLLGRTLGWGHVESTWLDVGRDRAGGFRFAGRGLGHGLGMCQSGAAAMSAAGRSLAAILRHYYPTARSHSIFDFPWESVGKVGTPTNFLGRPVTDPMRRSRGNW